MFCFHGYTQPARQPLFLKCYDAHSLSLLFYSPTTPFALQCMAENLAFVYMCDSQTHMYRNQPMARNAQITVFFLSFQSGCTLCFSFLASLLNFSPVHREHPVWHGSQPFHWSASTFSLFSYLFAAICAILLVFLWRRHNMQLWFFLLLILVHHHKTHHYSFVSFVYNPIQVKVTLNLMNSAIWFAPRCRKMKMRENWRRSSEFWTKTRGARLVLLAFRVSLVLSDQIR